MKGNAYRITMHDHTQRNPRKSFVVIAETATQAIEAASKHFAGKCVELSLIDGTVILPNAKVKGF